VAAALLLPSAAHAQVDCWAPREAQDSVSTQTFSRIRQTLLTLEDIIRKNAAYQAPPEPVRMRTTIAAGPSKTGGARIFVRAYPPVQTTANIQIWTKDRCDVIPQAERVAASVGQIYVFVNYSVQEQFLQGTELPKYEGEHAGYPIYNGWIVMTEGRRLPWIPQTLRDRLDREEQKRQRALDDWNAIYDLTNLAPGAKDDAMAFKLDPTFPDFTDPFRPQLIMVNFWSKSDPKDNSPRTTWLRQARETFDIAAVAALLR
jgi:hypothetical protein